MSRRKYSGITVYSREGDYVVLWKWNGNRYHFSQVLKAEDPETVSLIQSLNERSFRLGKND